MKKVIALFTVAFGGLAATSAQALPTALRVPGLPGHPYQTAPATSTSNQTPDHTSFGGQQLPATYKAPRARSAKAAIGDKKEARQEMRLQKKADKTGSR